MSKKNIGTRDAALAKIIVKKVVGGYMGARAMLKIMNQSMAQVDIVFP